VTITGEEAPAAAALLPLRSLCYTAGSSFLELLLPFFLPISAPRFSFNKPLPPLMPSSCSLPQVENAENA